jgi:hypothetical protein
LAWRTQAKRKPKGLLAKLLEDNPIGRNIVFGQVGKHEPCKSLSIS